MSQVIMYIQKQLINVMNTFIESQKFNVSALYLDINLMSVLFEFNTLKDQMFHMYKIHRS